MNIFDKNIILAFRISEIFKKSLVLNDTTLRFMESTFGASTPENLEMVICDEDSCEREPLLELIFFPDESFQIQLEDLLTAERFTDQEKVIQHLENRLHHVDICFPNSKDKQKIVFTHELIVQFVSRLKIKNNPDKELERVVREVVDQKLTSQVLVKIRNTDLPKAKHIIRFLCHFFKNIRSDNADFFTYLDFILRFSSELYGTIDVFKALMERKKSCVQAIQKALEYEKQLTKYNMEVMMLKGARNQCINVDEINKTVNIINQISLAMFGRTDCSNHGQEEIDLGVYDNKKDLNRVVKLLS